MSKVLVLSGGAFRGAVQVPILEYLFEKNNYDYIYGVSVGSINGVMVAQHELENLRKIWEDVEDLSGFLSSRWYWPFNGLYSMDPLRKKLQDMTSLSKVKIPYAAGIVSFTDGEYYNLHSLKMKSDVELHNAIEASSCMAGIMIAPKININNIQHIAADGGFRSIIPVPNKKSYDQVDVVTCTPLDRMKMKQRKEQRTDILSLCLRSIEIFEDEIFDKDILEIKNARHGKITVYSPQDYPGDSLDASKEMIKKRFLLGNEAIKNPLYLKK